MSAVLQARDIEVRYGSRSVLAGADLELFAGEFLALVGPNGAGKSTLLGVLTGDTKPARGDVLLGGRPLSQIGAAERSRERSVLTQSNEISFAFRVEDIVRMGRAPWRHRPERERDDELVALAMDAGEVVHYAERTVTGLSGGERARVAFARTRAQDCAIAMLDEPTASLDIRHQHRVLDETRAHVDAGGAAVVVLHDLALAAAYADRVAVLDDGHIVATGPPRAVLTSELLSRVYRHPVAVFDGPGGELIVSSRPRGSDPQTRADRRTIQEASE